MASAWGNAWLSAWGNAWGIISGNAVIIDEREFDVFCFKSFEIKSYSNTSKHTNVTGNTGASFDVFEGN